jgi:hypothetical protein
MVGMDLIYLSQVTDKWQDIAVAEMKILVP